MNILILEDELPAAEHLEKMLKKLDSEIRIVGKIRSVEGAANWFKDHAAPDLLLSDIHLLDGLCFDLFQITDIRCPVIFTTAYDQYAIRAFEVHSIDYLLKPISKEKLDLAIQKFKERELPAQTQDWEGAHSMHELLRALKGKEPQYKSRFMVRLGQRIMAITVEQIAYFYSESKLTFIVTEDGRKLPIDTPLNEIEGLLDPKSFFRINRQFIVKFTAIAEMHPYFKGRIKLKLQPDCQEEIVVSSERSPEFKSWLEQ
jgi:two-component system, LytTR family, response regulator LytT